MRLHHSFLAMFITLFTFSCQAETPEADPVKEQAFLKVVNVAPNDTLNVRQQANSESQVEFTLAPDAANILQLAKKGNWIKVQHMQKQGWAYAKYLQEAARPSLDQILGKAPHCFGTEPFWNLANESEGLVLDILGDENVVTLQTEPRISVNDLRVTVIKLDTDSRDYLATFTKTGQCGDGMSDNVYPFSITIAPEYGDILSGCCR